MWTDFQVEQTYISLGKSRSFSPLIYRYLLLITQIFHSKLFQQAMPWNYMSLLFEENNNNCLLHFTIIITYSYLMAKICFIPIQFVCFLFHCFYLLYFFTYTFKKCNFVLLIKDYLRCNVQSGSTVHDIELISDAGQLINIMTSRYYLLNLNF